MLIGDNVETTTRNSFQTFKNLKGRGVTIYGEGGFGERGGGRGRE